MKNLDEILKNLCSAKSDFKWNHQAGEIGSFDCEKESYDNILKILLESIEFLKGLQE